MLMVAMLGDAVDPAGGVMATTQVPAAPPVVIEIGCGVETPSGNDRAPEAPTHPAPVTE
jgi:hypothetical protein